MSVGIQKKTAAVRPDALRAWCRRHRVTATAIAERYGCSPTYITRALNSDHNGKRVTPDVLERIRDIAQKLDWEREL